MKTIYTIEGLAGYMLSSQMTKLVESLGYKPIRFSYLDKRSFEYFDIERG